MHDAVSRSVARSAALKSKELSKKSLQEVAAKAKSEIEAAFGDGSWLKTLPGRDILRAYYNTLPTGISHEILRTMIVNKMVDLDHRPEGMRLIIDEIQKLK